ncbi:MAG: hypothetical protein ISR76_06220 [Planctomycetes bacterium]|nr:hypothetical protein [Planctomycetota bacterium]MBL7008575.1 hypothetical protein [Planctomycetota bacterium]
MAGILALSGCSEVAEDPGLHAVSWPGSDGRPVVLNADLRVEFDRPLAPGLRAGAFHLFDFTSGEPVAAELEVAGRFLVFRPALPLSADLADGGLLPGRDYGIDLCGVPRLAAVAGRDGSVLVGTQRIRFRTLSAADPGALVAMDGGDEPLRVLPIGTANKHLVVQADGTVRFFLSGPVDPRTLAPARLLTSEGASKVEEVPLRLLSNSPAGSEIEAQVGLWTGWRRLELPGGLEGMGGRRLVETDRLLGLRGGP